MTDSTVNVIFDADLSGLESGVGSALNLLNSAFATTKIQSAAAKEPLGQLFSSLQKSSDSAVAGIIKGSETWQQALFNVAQSLEIKFAQLGVNTLINWVENLALKLAASQASNAQITASDTTAASASAATGAAQASAKLMSDAALTFGGVYAFLAPTLGPAAAAPATAAEAQVMSQLSLVSLDVGAWSVPQNMPAYLHAGEMVVPQNFASGLRNSGVSGGGGGDSYTINVNAVDTQTGAQFLKNNASVIASALSAQARNFNKNIPTWKN